MTEKKVWLVTGAGRGLGVDIARAALAAGHAVVATGRDTEKVMAAVGRHDDLLAVKLDVTRTEDAHAAVEATLARFGRIDVLVGGCHLKPRCTPAPQPGTRRYKASRERSDGSKAVTADGPVLGQ